MLADLGLEVSDTRDYTTVRLAQPVPVDIASCVFAALSQRFPGTIIDTTDPDYSHMTIRVLDADRLAAVDEVGAAVEGITPLTEEDKLDPLSQVELTYLGSGPSRDDDENDSMYATFTASVEVVSVFADAFASILDEADAPNYVEMTARNEKGAYIINVSRKGSPTPHELRRLAERTAADAQLELAEMRVALVKATEELERLRAAGS